MLFLVNQIKVRNKLFIYNADFMVLREAAKIVIFSGLSTKASQN